MKLLIVEDEKAIADLMIMNLQRVGYQCDYANDGDQAATMLEKTSYDLVLLDIMLPKVNGYELMEYIEPMHIPVIFITAKGSIKDRVKGLHMGADDYLAIDELLARVESVLRRYHKGMEDISILDIVIHTRLRTVSQNNQTIPLTRKEYDLLLYLVQNKNIALYRDTLYEKVWHDELEGNTRTLDLHIQRLRKKLNWAPHIKTIFRIGYMLEVSE